MAPLPKAFARNIQLQNGKHPLANVSFFWGKPIDHFLGEATKQTGATQLILTGGARAKHVAQAYEMSRLSLCLEGSGNERKGSLVDPMLDV